MNALAPLLLVAVAVPAAETRVDDVSRYVWDLSLVYRDQAAWEAERQAIREGIDAVGRFRGAVGRDARTLADVLDVVFDLRSRAARMAVYGYMVSDVDTRSEEARRQQDVGASLEAQVEAAVAFVAYEIRGIGEAGLRAWPKQEPRLERHQRRINRILREAPHAVPPEVEAALADMERQARQPSGFYWDIVESDLGWPRIRDAAGHEAVLDRATYVRMRASADPGERASASAYLGRLRALENVFGSLFVRRIESDLALARHRRFADGIEAIWFLRDGMPSGSHRVMIDVARANLPTLRRYVALRRRALGLDRVTYADLFAPPPASARPYKVSEAVEIAVASSAPLGAEYQARLRERLQKPWMHLPPMPGKRSVYAIWPPVGGIPPYTFMNYRGDVVSSQQLAGAAALMMAFADVPPGRIDTRDDPPIYSNALIYVGNILHDDYLRERATAREERISHLVRALTSVWDQIFRWTLDAELESRVQDAVMKGDPPSGRRISETYLALLREYYGNDPAVMSVDDAFAAEWATHRVLFLSYEEQFWPPAMAVACRIVERIRGGDAGVRDRFYRLYGRGALDLTYPMLREIGIDLAQPDAYESAVQRMNALMDELEKLVAHAPGEAAFEGQEPGGTVRLTYRKSGGEGLVVVLEKGGQPPQEFRFRRQGAP